MAINFNLILSDLYLRITSLDIFCLVKTFNSRKYQQEVSNQLVIVLMFLLRNITCILSKEEAACAWQQLQFFVIRIYGKTEI